MEEVGNWQLKFDLQESFQEEYMNLIAVVTKDSDCNSVLCGFEGQGGEPDYESYQL